MAGEEHGPKTWRLQLLLEALHEIKQAGGGRGQLRGLRSELVNLHSQTQELGIRLAIGHRLGSPFGHLFERVVASTIINISTIC
jgi:hypothetical protein